MKKQKGRQKNERKKSACGGKGVDSPKPQKKQINFFAKLGKSNRLPPKLEARLKKKLLSWKKRLKQKLSLIQKYLTNLLKPFVLMLQITAKNSPKEK